MAPIFLLYTIFAILSTGKVLFWTYLWQLKEYRRDRFLVHLKTLGLKEGVKVFLLGGKQCYPQPTARALGVVFLGLVLPFPLVFLKLSTFAIILILGLLWLLIPLLVLAGVLLTGVPIYFIKAALVELAKGRIRKFPHLKVVGITGSYGKTTTKDFLAQLLSGKFRVCRTEGTINTVLGVALTILRRLKADDEVFVVEMGAYRKGEIGEICKMVKPQVGMITGISSQHLALFGSLKSLMEAKFELVQALPEDGEAFFNGENEHCRELAEKAKIKKTLYYADGVKGYPLALPGFLKLNFAGAAAVASRLGMTDEDIKVAASGLKLAKTAPRVFSGFNGAKIIDDSFSANPDGFFAALDLLVRLGENKRRILVTPGIIELGQESKSFHQSLGEKAAAVCDEIIVTKKDFYHWIEAGVLAANPKVSCSLVEEPKEVLALLLNRLGAGTAVLVEGRVPSVIVKELKVKNLLHPSGEE